MSFPDSSVIAVAESRRLDPVESDHHEDCPQHPWNDLFDLPAACECEELRAEDAAEQGDIRNDVAGGA